MQPAQNKDRTEREREGQASLGKSKRDLQKIWPEDHKHLLAACTVIGAVIGTLTNALKSMADGLGKGLKEVGKKKTASPLPGLIG